MPNDRVGLGWRPELAAGIFDALDQIDVLEVIADDYVDAGRERRHSLKVLARQVPLHLHSIALGLADHLHDVTEPVYDLLSELAAADRHPGARRRLSADAGAAAGAGVGARSPGGRPPPARSVSGDASGRRTIVGAAPH